MKKNKNLEYANKLKQIRPFVEFNFNINSVKAGNISPADKRKITKYYNVIKEQAQKIHYVYRPRNKQRLKTARKFADMPNLPQLKNVVFLPTEEPNVKPKLNFSKNNKQIEVEENFVKSRIAYFNKEKLIEDPTAEVQRAIKKLPDAKQFTVRCGKFESIKSHLMGGKDKIVDVVIKLQNTYQNSEDWLNGLIGYEFKNQKDYMSHTMNKKRSREERDRIKRLDYNRQKSIDIIDAQLQVATDAEIINTLRKNRDNLVNLMGKLPRGEQ